MRKSVDDLPYYSDQGEGLLAPNPFEGGAGTLTFPSCPAFSSHARKCFLLFKSHCFALSHSPMIWAKHCNPLGMTAPYPPPGLVQAPAR